MIPDPLASRAPRGFTMIELLIVVVIVGILMSLLLPTLGGALRWYESLSCQNNLKQVALGVRSYVSSSAGEIPPTVVGTGEDASYWFNLLADGGYLEVPPATDYETDQITPRASVLVCPNAESRQVAATVAVGEPDDPLVQGFYRGGPAGEKVDCTYYWNGSSATGADAAHWPSLSQGASPDPSRIRTMSQVKRPSDMVMLADGIGYDAALEPARIAARHVGDRGDRTRTNVVFYDGHTGAIERIPGQDTADEDDDGGGDTGAWADDPIMGVPGLQRTEPPYFRLTDQR